MAQHLTDSWVCFEISFMITDHLLAIGTGIISHPITALSTLLLEEAIPFSTTTGLEQVNPRCTCLVTRHKSYAIFALT